MIQNVVTSIILYSGTAVDLLIILMLFFAKRKSRKDIINIYLGQFLGSVSLIFLSLLFAFVLNYIPSKEILGLLGLIPIFLGLKVLLLGDSDSLTFSKSISHSPEPLYTVFFKDREANYVNKLNPNFMHLLIIRNKYRLHSIHTLDQFHSFLVSQ